jgi:hypothetical protein
MTHVDGGLSKSSPGGRLYRSTVHDVSSRGATSSIVSDDMVSITEPYSCS